MTRLSMAATLAAGALAVLIGLLVGFGGATNLRPIFVGVNVATMLTYGYDKRASRSGGRRVSEATLHAMAAAGGTPGAFVGQLLLRHKTRDRRFRRIFWMIAVAQALVLTLVWWGHA